MEGWQRAFVLHSRPWSETSLMLDVFTEESGRVRLVAKGARSKRSTLKGALQPFTPLLLRFGGRGEVKSFSPQPEAPVCQLFLLRRPGHRPLGGHPGPLQYQHHPDLYRHIRR